MIGTVGPTRTVRASTNGRTTAASNVCSTQQHGAAPQRRPHPSRPNASSSAGMPPTMHADERQHGQRPDDEAEAERGRQVEHPARDADDERR